MSRTRFTLIAATLAVAATVPSSATAYYHAQLGRFLNRDPIGYRAGDANLYRYVDGNPVNSVDPSGLSVAPRRKPMPGVLGDMHNSRWGDFIGTFGLAPTPVGTPVAAGSSTRAPAWNPWSLFTKVVVGVRVALWETRMGDATIRDDPRISRRRKCNCRANHPLWSPCKPGAVFLPEGPAQSYLKQSCPKADIWLDECFVIPNIPTNCGVGGGRQYHCPLVGWSVGGKPVGYHYRVSVKCCNCCTTGPESYEGQNCSSPHWSNKKRPPPDICY